MALVVYGVMLAGDCPDELCVEWRERTLAVRSIEQDGVCALIGDAPDGPMRVRRDELLAHTEVLHAAMERGAILPLQFGVVLADDDAVRNDLLAPRASALAARLASLEGTAEFQLKVTFDSERILASMLASDRRLADVAALVKALPGSAGHFDRIRLGEMIAERIEARAQAVDASVMAKLEPLAVAVTRGSRHHEWMALNAAFLVDLARRADFDEAVDGLSAEHSGELHFRLVGPLPPHSFAEDDVQVGAAWA